MDNTPLYRTVSNVAKNRASWTSVVHKPSRKAISASEKVGANGTRLWTLPVQKKLAIFEAFYVRFVGQGPNVRRPPNEGRAFMRSGIDKGLKSEAV